MIMETWNLMSATKIKPAAERIRTKAISQLPEEIDGLRFFVVLYPMNVGRKYYFEWLPVLAPSEKLFWQWKKHKITWAKFDSEYRQQITSDPQAQKKIQQLRSLLDDGQTITLLCFEAEWRHDCHRHILKQIILDSRMD
jgi:uncharacterized protein YeaO (DUF488 family)